MGRNDKVSTMGNKQPVQYVLLKWNDRLYLPVQCYRVYYNSIPYQVQTMLVEHAGRYGMENNLITIHIQSMACIRPALKAGYNIVLCSKVVYYLSLSLIAPLQAEQNIYHWIFLKARKIINL